MNKVHEVEERGRVVHVALRPPAVRTVLVRSRAVKSDHWYTRSVVYPVLTVKTVVVRTYLNDSPGEPFWDSEELLAKHGWRPAVEQEVTYFAVNRHDMACTEDWPTGHSGISEDDSGVEIARVVVCDWPPEEDDERLTEVKRDQERQALDRAKCRSEQEAARAVAGRVPAE